MARTRTWMCCATIALGAAIAPATVASAQTDTASFQWGVSYITDVVSVARGEESQQAALSKLSAHATWDLDRAMGWRGWNAHVELLRTAGDAPNHFAGLREGFDSIEVQHHDTRLYQAYLDRAFERGLLRLGYFDLNAEFYDTQSSQLFLAPAFGVGAEFAATGRNGPSIFPVTALGAFARLDVDERHYVRMAIVDALASGADEWSDLDLRWNDGALLIAEVGSSGNGKTAVGAWTYSRARDDIRSVVGGEPIQRPAFGGYGLIERRLGLAASPDRPIEVFARAGFSDGDTSDFVESAQAGVRVERPLLSRPGSELAFGLHVAELSSKARANLRDQGVRAAASEIGAELTYSDVVFRHLRLQPVVQVNFNPGGVGSASPVFISVLRLEIALGPEP